MIALEKKTLTFYLPGDIFKQAKIYAVTNGISFSEMAVRSVLALIEDDGFDLTKKTPANDEKALVYLTEEEKKNIQLFAAAKAATISELFYQAFEHQYNTKITAANKASDAGKKHRKSKPVLAKRNPFSFKLTHENYSKLRFLSVDTGRSRTYLIMEAVEKTDKEIIKTVLSQKPKEFRTSMDLDSEMRSFIKKRAKELGLGVSELINRSLALL